MKNDFSVRGGKHAAILGKFNGESFEALTPQMPGMVSPMQKADGFILIPPETKTLASGKIVNMLAIKWEFCSGEKEEVFSR